MDNFIMLNSKEIEQLSKSFFTNLKIMNLFKKTEFHERYGNQIIRNHRQLNNLVRRFEIGEHHMENYLKWNNEHIPTMPMTKFDYTVELTTLFTNHGLATYEALKRFFLETIELEKLNEITKERIHSASTWGSLTRAISRVPCVDQRVITELFDVDFRNALAHDTWYFENNSLKYLDMKKNIVTILFKDLVPKIHTIFGFYVITTQNYFEAYFPELKEQYAQMEADLNKEIPIFEPTTHDKNNDK